MSIPPSVGPSVSAAYGASKDVFLHKNHRRRHVIDLPHNFETLKDQVDSLCARWKVVHDDINRQSATRQENDYHAACCNELERILKYYQQNIVNRYKKLVGLESGGNQTPVHELSAASKGWKNKFCTPTFYKLARLDKDVLKFTPEVTNLENKITLEHVTSPINPEIVVTQSAKDLTHVPSHQAVLDSLVCCLNEAGCKRIAIYGEPQVGKTNILRNLNNRLVRCAPALELDYVIWVSFPTHLPKPEDIITTIEEKILQHLDLNAQSSPSGKKVVISRALREKSYLLLFDGFSSSIELEDIGIFEEHEHGKVIIEAKDPYLLRNFRFDKAVKIERLPPQDSRKLFDKIIDDETLCEQNTVLADLIVKELGGLPGVITSVAGQLKINKRVQYWEGMIQRLKADIWDNNLRELAGLAGVKLAFDTAYSKLNENDRKCILYAALFPKEFTIPIDILVECWKAEEFLRCPIPTFSHAQREGACVLKQLIELNLLEKCFEHQVKMPIIYRRLALEAPFPGEKNATSFVRSGPEIDGHLKDEEWEMVRRVSLIRSQLEELPVSPKCEGMSTLFLQLNPNLRIIEEPFFRRMQNLRVLDLHSTGIKLLPPSISYLTSLRSLYLNNCCDLTVLPPEIVELKKLEVLDIRGTSIHCLPEEISSLFGLRRLRFSFVLDACNPNPEPKRKWLIFSPGTANQLNKLEELTIVLVNGSSEGIVDQIETEVLEFKNKNNQFKLILLRPSQSVDQGNLVQLEGKGVYLPNPSIPASHVQDPTTGNHPSVPASVPASHVHDPTIGNPSPRSDYQVPVTQVQSPIATAYQTISCPGNPSLQFARYRPDLTADAILGSTVQVLVEMAINFTCGKIGQSSELEKDLKNLKRTLILIQDVLHDAEKRQVNESSVKHWLEGVERVAFDAENLLDTFNYEMIRREVENQNQRKRKLGRSDSREFHSNMASKIQKINADFTSINEQASKLGLLQSQNVARDATAFMENRKTDSVTTDTSFVGRDDNVSAIVTELTATSNNETISVLPIVGMGGIGKTTVARKVFNILNIENHFDKRMWVCVSDFKKHFDANRLFSLMLESLEVPMPEVASKEAKVRKLKELLDGKESNGKKPLKYLLVLDDVWNQDPAPWNGFLDSLRGISSAKGSWILVTTRNKQMATITAIPSHPCSLEELLDYDCWLILEKKAFGSREAPNDLKELGLEIAKKCHGLPLAASVLGGMLCNKEIDVWRSILQTGLQNIGGDGDSYITKILRLSFDHLPYPALKKCFAYCSIFPRDFQMERNQLIQLWAAEGFLHSNPRKKMCMEEVGNKYFTILLDRNLFQDAKKDAYGNFLNCKMHDLVHDMLQSISESKTLRLKESTKADFPDKTFRYLAMDRSDGQEIPPFPQNENFRCITTLFLRENRSIDDGLISFLACLRVLNIASSGAKELPKSIDKLSHLRYLDSSNTPMETLSDSVCKLYNLQTLRLQDCRSLTEFPNNFKNLVNLRHFDFFPRDKSSDLTPLEIGQLHSLQTLPFFNIGKMSGRKIGQLGSLKNLSGSFEIRNLELVSNKEEANSAKLIEKPNIDVLKLLWNESRKNDSKCNQVLEGLQPHQNLKGLIIERFFGEQLSTWIGELRKLVKFELRNCRNCKELPTLGNMPFLRSLHLKGLDSITSIGPSFYGGSGMHSGNGSQRPLKLFPALEDLILEEMPGLREWMEATIHVGTVVVFPVLHTVRIIDCPQLATFPSHFPHLKELNIWKTQNGSALMTYICNGVSTLTGLFVESMNGLTKLPNMLFQNNPKLAHLCLRDCGDLTQFLDFSFDVSQTLEGPNCQSVAEQTCIDNNAPQHLVGLESLETLTVTGCHGLESISIPKGRKYLTALRQLEIQWCYRLTHFSIPQISESEWDSTSSPFSSSDTCPPALPLVKLSVSTCPSLISFPIDLTRTPSLSWLDISVCEKLTDLPKGKLCSLTRLDGLLIGPFSETTTELHSFLDLFDALPPPHPYFPSLSYLFLFGWPHWESLPEQLQHLSALTELQLEGFGVKSLPEWFEKLSSLERLELWNCKKLENLPSHQSMRSLTRLGDLRITDCPLLKEGCNPERSSEWSKISHIPSIEIDWEDI